MGRIGKRGGSADAVPARRDERPPGRLSQDRPGRVSQDQPAQDQPGQDRPAAGRIAALDPEHPSARSPVPRQRDHDADQDGSWHGDRGGYLSPADNAVANRTLDQVATAEPAVTRTLQAIEAAVPDTRLAGLKHRLKGPDRFKEKVAEEIEVKTSDTTQQICRDIPDSLRYTFTSGTDNYSADCRATVGELRSAGFSLLEFRNRWAGDQYKGINTRWCDLNGQLFEIQFHTEESYDAKQLTHTVYERLRGEQVPDHERGELAEYQTAVSSQITIPRDALNLTGKN